MMRDNFAESDIGKEVQIGNKCFVIISDLKDGTKLAPKAKSSSYKNRNRARMMAAMAQERLELLDHAQRREEIRAQRVEALPAGMLKVVA